MNLSKLNNELYVVHQIMSRNVQVLLGVGEMYTGFPQRN